MEGRLTLEEFSDRVSRAQAARTDRELTVDLPALPSRPAPQAAPARYRATFAKLVRRGAWEIPAHSKWRCLCGTIVLDLREGRLPGPEVELEIYNSFGTVTVLVPAGIAVEVEGGGMFASQVLEPPAWPPPPGAPGLKIRVAGSGGTLRIRSSAHRHSRGSRSPSARVEDPAQGAPAAEVPVRLAHAAPGRDGGEKRGWWKHKRPIAPRICVAAEEKRSSRLRPLTRPLGTTSERLRCAPTATALGEERSPAPETAGDRIGHKAVAPERPSRWNSAGTSTHRRRRSFASMRERSTSSSRAVRRCRSPSRVKATVMLPGPATRFPCSATNRRRLRSAARFVPQSDARIRQQYRLAASPCR